MGTPETAIEAAMTGNDGEGSEEKFVALYRMRCSNRGVHRSSPPCLCIDVIGELRDPVVIRPSVW